MVDDEEATLAKLNHVCEKDQHIFSGLRIPKRRLPITTNLAEEQEEVIVENEQRKVNMGFEATMKSKILFHFMKGKIVFNSHGNHSHNSRKTGIFERTS